MNRTHAARWFWLFIIIAACVFMLLPLFRTGFPITDDGQWMVIRLSAFYQTLREGQFPVRFLGRLNYSYGYPVANFLYPGYLYMGSVIHAAGFSFQHTVEAILAGSVVVGVLFLFLWLRRSFSLSASSLGALSFLFMPYLLYDIFKRGSVGEVMAIACSMVSLYAIESKNKLIAPLALFMLAISHNTLALFFLPVLLGYIVVKGYWTMLWPYIIGVGMSSFFWVAAFFDKSMVIFDSVSVSDPKHYFPASMAILVHSLPFILACIMSFFVKDPKPSKERWYIFALFAGSIFLATPISSFLWNNQVFAKFIQFPFRVFALWSFIGPWYIASLAQGNRDVKRFFLVGLFVLVLFGWSWQYQKGESVVRSEGFFTTNEATTTVADEYMPGWVAVRPLARANQRLEVHSGNIEIDERHVTTEKIEAILNAREQSTLQINTIYYPGWGALLDNRPITISYNNPMGVMRVAVPAGTHKLYMAFRETRRRFVADTLTVIFFILYIVVCVVPFMTQKTAIGNQKKKRHI
jgi:hypothetical protein